MNIGYVEDYQRGGRGRRICYDGDMKYTVGVTGHRKLVGSRDVVAGKTTEFLKTIKEASLVREEEIQVISGMALGFDQLVCDVCLQLEIPYVAAVPCDNQDALWPLPQKNKYADLLAKASSIVVVNPGPYEAWKMHARNSWIVNNSNEMVVYWDGYYQGGTGNCMKLVKSKKLTWRNVFLEQ